MPEMNRRNFLVGLGVVTVAAVATTTVLSAVKLPLRVQRLDWGLQLATDTKGNVFDAYITEFGWNGKQTIVAVDRVIGDLSGNLDEMRRQEELAALDHIAYSEGRELSAIRIDDGWDMLGFKPLEHA